MQEPKVTRIRLLVYQGPQRHMEIQKSKDLRHHRWNEMEMESFEVEGEAFDKLVESLKEARWAAEQEASKILSEALEKEIQDIKENNK